MSAIEAARIAGAILFLAAMLRAAATDLSTRRIEDTVVVALALGFLVLAPFAGLGWRDVALALAAGAATLAGAVALFALGAMGGGDGKLAAATALWIGPGGLPGYLTAVALAGGVLAVAILALRALPARRPAAAPRWLRLLRRRRGGVPYAVALAAGGLVALCDTIWAAGWPGDWLAGAG